jgi:hypothetical protein
MLASASAAGAQRGVSTPAEHQPFATVAGRVVTPDEKREIPVPGVMVTVHRVGSDSSGALDSVRADAAGRYSLRYPRFGDEDAIYFAAAVYRGIAYFSAPLRSARANGEESEITVFDTTSHAVEFHVRGHHLVVSSPRPNGERDVVEVWELSNDTTVTVIGRDTLAPVWSAPLPAGATRVVGGQGDVGPNAIAARGGRVVLLAPFGPGVKQLSYAYTMPSSAFPLSLTLEGPTSVLEVLLEEPAAQVTGGLLRATAAATTQGRTFKRFQSQDIPDGQRVRITVPVTTAATRTLVLSALAATIALIMAGALARALMSRSRRVSRVVPTASHSERLLAAIAQLDARRESGDVVLDDARYAAERSALKTQLATALAAEGRIV